MEQSRLIESRMDDLAEYAWPSQFLHTLAFNQNSQHWHSIKTHNRIKIYILCIIKTEYSQQNYIQREPRHWNCLAGSLKQL